MKYTSMTLKELKHCLDALVRARKDGIISPGTYICMYREINDEIIRREGPSHYLYQLNIDAWNRAKGVI